MKVIGVVGGMGTGKSTVVNLISQMTQAHVIQADKIGHGILKKGNPAYKPTVQCFGPEILGPDGEIDRQILGGIVFSDPLKLKQLNAISHPLIYDSVKEAIQKAKAKGLYQYIVVDAALLIEIGLVELVQEVWGVYLPLEEQIKRVMLRNNFSKQEAKRRISTQLPWEEIQKVVTRKIDNSGSIESTKEEVRRFLK